MWRERILWLKCQYTPTKVLIKQKYIDCQNKSSSFRSQNIVCILHFSTFSTCFLFCSFVLTLKIGRTTNFRFVLRAKTISGEGEREYTNYSTIRSSKQEKQNKQIKFQERKRKFRETGTEFWTLEEKKRKSS